jgi:parvulin-like peptidyl-prolyl isomerase
MLEVFDKAFSIPLYKPSATFSSPYGFHIFRVENKLTAGTQKLSEVRESIELVLKGQKEQSLYKDWLNKEIKKIHVYKDHKMIQAMSIETRSK